MSVSITNETSSEISLSSTLTKLEREVQQKTSRKSKKSSATKRSTRSSTRELRDTPISSAKPVSPSVDNVVKQNIKDCAVPAASKPMQKNIRHLDSADTKVLKRKREDSRLRRRLLDMGASRKLSHKSSESEHIIVRLSKKNDSGQLACVLNNSKYKLSPNSCRNISGRINAFKAQKQIGRNLNTTDFKYNSIMSKSGRGSMALKLKKGVADSRKMSRFSALCHRKQPALRSVAGKLIGKNLRQRDGARNSQNAGDQRPKRNIAPRKSDEALGLSWREETALNRALYASLHKRDIDSKHSGRSRSAEPSEPNVRTTTKFSHASNAQSCRGPRSKSNSGMYHSTSTNQKLDSSSMSRSQSAATLTCLALSCTNSTQHGAEVDGSEQNSEDSNIVTTPITIRAQRKFASGCRPDSPSVASMVLKTSLDCRPAVRRNLFPKHTITTEDFITFLCLRGTQMLPPRLEFFNYSDSGSLSSFPNTPVSQSEASRPETPDVNSSESTSHPLAAASSTTNVSKASSSKLQARGSSRMISVSRKKLERFKLDKNATGSKTLEQKSASTRKSSSVRNPSTSADEISSKRQTLSSSSRPPHCPLSRSQSSRSLEVLHAGKVVHGQKVVPPSASVSSRTSASSVSSATTERFRALGRKSSVVASHRGRITGRVLRSRVCDPTNDSFSGSNPLKDIEIERSNSARGSRPTIESYSARGSNTTKGSDQVQSLGPGRPNPPCVRVGQSKDKPSIQSSRGTVRPGSASKNFAATRKRVIVSTRSVVATRSDETVAKRQRRLSEKQIRDRFIVERRLSSNAGE